MLCVCVQRKTERCGGDVKGGNVEYKFFFFCSSKAWRSERGTGVWCGQERRRWSRDEHGLGFGFIAGGDAIEGSEAATRGRGQGGEGEAWA
ncbi:hypothetical protein M0R45_032025 [Rubus argutus]|uniref:Uncharacterized protein n=1 Tax=Rubus argutus TaxID=59490 RepID=A0AAW1WG23_RUBAR